VNADAKGAEHSKRGAGGFSDMPRGLSLPGTIDHRSPVFVASCRSGAQPSRASRSQLRH